MIRVGCLHTAESNIAVFENALRKSGLASVELEHYVRIDLLQAAENAGGVTAKVSEQTIEEINRIRENVDVVLMTCSTLGPIADSVAEESSVPILRVDAALAHHSVQSGGRVAVLCAVETTLQPTRLLFEKEARLTGAQIVVSLVPNAWEMFKAGDTKGYFAVIASAVGKAMMDGATFVALAQSSMSGAAELITNGERPFTSPEAGLAAAVRAVRDNQNS